MNEGVTTKKVVRYRGGPVADSDAVVVEEPMELRMSGEALAVVMRTPGHEEELALGFAITEGIVDLPTDIEDVVDLGEGRWEFSLADGVEIDVDRFKRNFYATSSCGVCGKASIDAIRVARSYPPRGPLLSEDVIMSLPAKLLSGQAAFQATGGLHAAAAFTPDGTLVAIREDIGRHNATDKLVGHLAKEHWPLPPLVLLVSGRTSFEIVQKAAVAGISVVCGVSAASSLAVELAEEFGMTLIGFLRDEGFTVYADTDRLKSS